MYPLRRTYSIWYNYAHYYESQMSIASEAAGYSSFLLLILGEQQREQALILRKNKIESEPCFPFGKQISFRRCS